jgi:hypothetical protein
MRIAMARLRKTYPFKPQRRAVAAKMWSDYLERKAMKGWFKYQESQCQAHARWQDEEEKLNKSTNGHHRSEWQYRRAL